MKKITIILVSLILVGCGEPLTVEEIKISLKNCNGITDLKNISYDSSAFTYTCNNGMSRSDDRL